jgi:hypothetical protein
MPEPLTSQLVAELMRDLLAAFPSKHSEKNLTHTADVYRNGLRGVSGDALRASVAVCIKSDSYFPKVARLRELATEWTKRNTVAPLIVKDSRVCRVCGVEPYPQQRWKPAVDTKYQPLMRDGFLLLEGFTRDLCDCAGPCWYAPEPDRSDHVCAPENVQRAYKVWLEKRSETRRPEASDAA